MKRLKRSRWHRGSILAGLAVLVALPFVARAAAPTVSFTAPPPAPIDESQTGLPFIRINIDDLENDDVTVRITFPDAVGTFSPGGGLTKSAAGTYDLSARSPAAAQTFLRNLGFTPNRNLIPDNEVLTNVFAVRVTDSTSAFADGSVALEITGDNFDPAVSFNSPPPSDINDKATGRPFVRVNISDIDGDDVTIRITFPDANGSFTTNLDLAKVGPGIYELSARPPAAAQTYLRALDFIPTENRIPIGSSEDTTFTVRATDGAGAFDEGNVTFTVTPVNDAPHFTGSLSPTIINDNTSYQLLTGFAFTDVDNMATQTLRLTLTLTEGAPATWRGGVRVTNIIGSPLAVSALVQGLWLDPIPNRAPPGQTNSFTIGVNLQDFASLNSPDNSTPSVSIVSINDPPTVSPSFNPPSIPDTIDVTPFRIVVNDPDVNESMTVMIEPVTDTNFYFGTVSTLGPFTGSTGMVATAIQSVRFTPIRNRATNSQALEFRFRATDVRGTQATATATLTLNAVNDPPNITGVPASTAQITDDPNQTPIRLLPNVGVVDPDAGETNVTVTLSLSDPSKGAFSASSFSGTPSQVTDAIRATTFLPNRTSDRVLGQTITLTILIAARDSGNLVQSNSQAKVAITAVNGSPSITVPSSQPVLIPPAPPILPFTSNRVSIIDDDVDTIVTTNGGGGTVTNRIPSNRLTVSVTIDNPAKGVLTNLGGFNPVGGGVYRITTNYVTATAALSNMEYAVNPAFVFPPNAPGGTRFTIEAVDAALNRTTKTYDILLQNEPVNHLVTSVEDDWSPGTLRYALTNAGNNDTITFAFTNGYPRTIRLQHTNGPLVVMRNLTFRGHGADLITISGDSDADGDADTQLFRVFASVRIEGVTLTKGLGGAALDGPITGGAIYVGPTGRLILSYCAITDCVAAQWGGAVDVGQGSLDVDHCFFRNNATDTALGLGGGAVSIYTDLPCSFVNTTFSQNRQRAPTGYGGGAIYVENYDNTVNLNVSVVHCTFVGNEDAAGLGTSLDANAFGTVVTLRNSIFADGRDNNLKVQGAADIISEGGNVSDDNTRAILTQNGQPQAVILLSQSSDATNANVRLSGLNTNQKPTPVYLPLLGSPAIGRAVGLGEATDQRGVIRDSSPDSGAAERNATRRVVLNEIHFDNGTNGSDFVELYVPRSATSSLDIGNYALWIDGVRRHVFASGTAIMPGRGVVIADTLIAAGDPSNANPTVVVTPLSGTNAGPLNLASRGTIELRKPDGSDINGRPVWSVAYNGVFAPDVPPFAASSLTLLPQFVGAAYVPHRMISAETNSPGRDTMNTPFGSPNALPVASSDVFLVGEDQLTTLDVLVNDSDADGNDLLFIVDVSRTMGQGGDDAATNSLREVPVSIDPGTTPLRGTSVIYDPRHTAGLQSLPVGATRSDEFYYSIVDFGSGEIVDYVTNGAVTTVVSPAHRLTNGEQIVISGALTLTNIYNGTQTVTRLNDDAFTIPVQFVENPVVKGSWVTVATRQPTVRSEAKVTLTVLGANDPPTPAADLAATTEEQLLRVMADAVLAGSTNTTFDTDASYPAVPVISLTSLLNNDSDPDTDDTKATLRVVGVVGGVNAISDFEELAPGVKVIVPNHGLANGSKVVISGYGGYPSYNGLHTITVVDSNSFSIPVLFVDNDAVKGVWAPFDDSARLVTRSEHDAEVRLEIRNDRIETSLVYNPRTSAFLNGLGTSNGVPEVAPDTFYYAVEDSHGAISLAQVTIQVSGVNDTPVPRNNPSSLDNLNSLVSDGRTLEQVITQLEVIYFVAPASGGSNRVDARVEFTDGSLFFLSDLWQTDEQTPIGILSADITANDSDVDRINVLGVSAVSALSHQGAAVALSGDRSVVTYDPRGSAALNALAREETVIDTFYVTVTDAEGGNVTNLISVLVVGVNDTPVAQDDASETPEDVALLFNPITFPPGNPAMHDYDVDINGHVPDNVLAVVPVSNLLTPGGALVNISNNVLNYDPSVSAFLDGLAVGQTYVDVFPYTVSDSSLLFANNDMFKVTADGSGYALDVLANDSNYNVPSPVSIVSFTAGSRGGIVTTNGGGTQIVYTPEVNFVGDEVFVYTVADAWGNEDSAIVTVRVIVNQLNGNLQANADAFAVAKGESPVLDVLANDNIIPASGASLAITRIVAPPSANGSAVITLGGIRYTPDPANLSDAYTETFSYEVTGGGTARAVAQVTVLVTNRAGTLTIRDDAFSVPAGSQNNPLNVLANDNILPGSPAGLTIRSIETNGVHGLVEINATGTGLIFTPDPSFLGDDTNLTYVVSDGLGGTGVGRIRISVGNLTTCRDTFVVNATNAALLDVLANDAVLQQPSGVVTLVGASPASTSLGSITVSNNQLQFIPTGMAGETNLSYTVQDGAGGTAQGEVTIIVVAATGSDEVYANADFFAALTGSTGNELNVLANDAAVPNRNRPFTIVSAGTGVDGPNRGGTVSINASSDRLIYTPAPGFSGEETFTYTMTDSRVFDTATVVVKVRSGDIFANDDSFTVFFEEPPTSFTLEVLANDGIAPDFGQVLTITGVGIDDVNATNAPTQHGMVQIAADGASLIYTPTDTNAAFPYVERFTYEVTDGSARRAQAVVLVHVLRRAGAHELDTRDDFFTVAADSANNILNVLVNDNVKPATADSWSITGISVAPSNGAAAVVGQTISYTPRTNFIGTDRFVYAVSDGLGGTAEALVTVKVGDVSVCPDTFVVMSGTSNNVLPVLVNDVIQPGSGKILAIGAVGAPDCTGTAVLSGDGRTILYTPDSFCIIDRPATYPYEERFWYDVADDSGNLYRGQVTVQVFETGSDRDGAIVSITVHGVNDAPTIVGTATQPLITDKETATPFAGVTIGDVDDQGMELLTVKIIIDDPAKGMLMNLGGFVQTPLGTYTMSGTPSNVTASIRGIVFMPTENRITVPTTENTVFTITANDSHVTTTDIATVVPVQAVNDAPWISGTVAGLRVYNRATIRPFYAARVSELDDLRQQPLRVTVTLDDATHGFFTSLGGFVATAPGTYVLSNATALAVTLALENLVFVPTTSNRVSIGVFETTRFTIAVDDGFAATVLDTNTTVTAIDGLVARLQASDRAESGQNVVEYGRAVAATRDFVAVGEPKDDHNGNSGSVFVYARRLDGSEAWAESRKIYPPDGNNGDLFGFAVAMNGDTLVVGAPEDDDRGNGSGSVYVFRRHQGGSNNWGFAAKVVPADGAAADAFGYAVSIDGDTLVVGAHGDDDRGNNAGSAYVYSRTGTNWTLTQKVTALDGAAGDDFGSALSVHADTLVVGAPLRNETLSDCGAAYVFSRNVSGSNSWGQVKKLLPGDAAADDHFGHSVGVDRDHIVVGAPMNDDLGTDSGSAYVFRQDLGGSNLWVQVKKLLPGDGAGADQFGFAVSIDRDNVVAGAPFDDDRGTDSGSAYLFARNAGGTNQWNQTEKFIPNLVAANGNFGYALAVDRNTLIVGAPFDATDNGTKYGAIYIFRLKFNNAPGVVNPIQDQIVQSDSSFSFTIPFGTFDDPDIAEMLSYGASLSPSGALPAWLSFNPVTQTFSGAPTAADIGVVAIAVKVTDEDDESVTDVFNITVSATGALELWRIAHFGAEIVADPAKESAVWGNAADPDGDGLSNAAEYLNGTDPLAPNLLLVPLRLSIACDRVTGEVWLKYQRRSNDPHLVYALETSVDGTGWASAVPDINSETVVPISAEFSEVTVLLRDPNLRAAPALFRVRVTVAP